jgi:hypothetical protein
MTECPKCLYRFASAQALRRHLALKVGCDAKLFQCEKCSRKFLNNSTCTRHEAKCTGQDKRLKPTLADAQRVAVERGGKCLTETEIENTRQMVRLQCRKGHEWDAVFKNLLYMGTWCPECSGRKQLTLKDAQQVAHDRGGSLLSEEYDNTYTRMSWKCGDADHKPWLATLNSVKNYGTWCPECYGNAKHTLADAVRLAGSRGGKCLPTQYVNAVEPMMWQCDKQDTHIWAASYHGIHNGTWCPYCKWKNEAECRDILEELLGESFPTIKKAPWLDGMDLDGWCAKLGLAFEYNGKQHYEYSPFFHRNGMEDLHAQQARDAKKEEMCNDTWLTLLTIPYHVDKEEYIADQLRLLGYMQPC